MGNTRNTGYLQNVVKVSDTGNIAFMSGSTMLMQISSSGAISSSATTVSSSVDNLVVNNNAVLGSNESSTVSIPAFIASDLYPIADTYKLGSPSNYWTTAYVQTGSFNAVNVTGKITAQTLVVQTITSSVDFVTGSTRFGTLLANTHTFTGSMNLTGSLTSIGHITTSQSLYSVANIVAGGATPLHLSYASSDGLGPAIRLGSGAQGFWDIQPSNNNQRLTFDWNDVVNVLSISSSGFVGIGTNTPDQLLTMIGSGSATAAKVSTVSNHASFFEASSNNSAVIVRLQSQTSPFVGTLTNTTFDIVAGGNIAIRTTGSGNVGIGTTNPRTRLQVTPSSNAETPVPGTATGVAIFTSANTNYGLQFNSTSDGSFHIQSQRFDGSSTVYNLVLQPAGGNVSIGTSSNPEVWQNPGLKIYGTRPSIDLVNSGAGTLNSIRWYAPGAVGRELHMNYDTTSTMWALRFNSYFLSGGAASHSFNGDGSMSIVGALTQNTSDSRTKKNKQAITNALGKILILNGITFEWDKNIVPFMNRTTDVGVIAQEVQAVLPDAVTLAPFDIDEQTGLSKSGENYLTVYYEKLIPLLIEGIKELKAENDTLKEILQRNNIQ